MATLKIDSVIVSFLKKVMESGRLFTSSDTISIVVEESILYFLHKDQNCFTCDFHRDMVVGLEVGRQKMANDKLGQEPPKEIGHWVIVDRKVLDLAKNYAKYYRRTAKVVLEQAILESLTRPAQCQNCPRFADMKAKIKEKNHGSPTISKTDFCSSSPSHGAQPDGCSGGSEKPSGVHEEIRLQNPDSNGPRDGEQLGTTF